MNNFLRNINPVSNIWRTHSDPKVASFHAKIDDSFSNYFKKPKLKQVLYTSKINIPGAVQK